MSHAESDREAREATYQGAVEAGRYWGRFRPIIGFVGLILLGIKFIQARNDANDAPDPGVEMVLYVPHLFDVALIVGAMLALYIITRMAD